ncbi:hypothetical protein GCM10011405_03850 [Rufibacter glacialis]|nr:hypothetical protein GCM10011405_03850 [Rufibacter glacialis]
MCTFRGKYIFSLETIGHHTVEDRGNPDHVENHAPFKCESKTAYLTDGYYFWDNNLDLAHLWGEIRIKKPYMICEAKLTLDESILLDLVGNRGDVLYLEALITKYGLHQLDLAGVIRYLVDINKKEKGAFEYQAIRAVDMNLSEHYKTLKFVHSKRGWTNLNAAIFICLLTKSTVLLRDLRIIYPEEYTS